MLPLFLSGILEDIDGGQEEAFEGFPMFIF